MSHPECRNQREMARGRYRRKRRRRRNSRNRQNHRNHLNQRNWWILIGFCSIDGCRNTWEFINHCFVGREGNIFTWCLLVVDTSNNLIGTSFDYVPSFFCFFAYFSRTLPVSRRQCRNQREIARGRYRWKRRRRTNIRNRRNSRNRQNQPNHWICWIQNGFD